MNQASAPTAVQPHLEVEQPHLDTDRCDCLMVQCHQPADWSLQMVGSASGTLYAVGRLHCAPLRHESRAAEKSLCAWRNPLSATCHRHRERERAALFQLALDFDLTALHLNQVLGDGKAQPVPRHVAHTLVAGAEEFLP